ncbi:MAG: cell wall metabolism sensor histidine kinase WalK [Actinomycetota bacterium]|nr:cell wall metabolism sensor histidine kinase WalK [Actinomycetota bacterium]
MFDSFLAVPLHFTIEFLGFLVMAAGAFLVASRPDLIPGGATNRGSATIGFVVLAVAQVAHGGSFLQSGEGDEILVALKTFGFALVLIGVVGGVRQAAPVPVVFAAPASETMIMAPALAAGAVGLMALVSSYRGATRDLRRLAFGALLIGVSEAVVGLSPLSTATALSSGADVGAHVLRGVGYLMLAAWLWTAVRSSIRTRFVASFVALLLLVVLALSTALTGVITSNVEEGELRRVEEQLQTVRAGLARTQVTDTQNEAAQATEADVVQNSLQGRGELSGVAQAVVLSPLFETDYVLLLDPKGGLRGNAGDGPYLRNLRNREPISDELLLDMIGLPVIDSVADKSLRFDQAGDLALIGDYPAVVGVAEVPPINEAGSTVPGSPVGLVMFVEFIDRRDMQDIAGNVGAQASVVIGNDLLASSFGKRVRAETSGRTLVPKTTRDELAGSFSPAATTAHRPEIAERTYFSAVTELRSTERVLGYLVLSSPASDIAGVREGVTRTLFLVALGSGAIVLVLAYFSGSRITRPIQMLTETAQRVREGDLQAQTEVSGTDEVGQLGETFNEMTSSLLRMTSDLREAAREEHRLRARIETIMQSMADGLVAVNADRTVMLFNREAENLLGVSVEEAEDLPVEDVLQARDQQGEPINLPIFDLGEGSTSGIFLVAANGDPVPVTIVSAALRNEEGDTVGGVAVVRDMTREREVERMKSEFLSNISHELRTPLTPIKGYAEILSRKQMPADKTKQFTKGILESTERLERIVELLVDFAALEAGRLSPRTASVDLAGMVEKLAHDWEERTSRHTVVAEVGAKLPQVIGDERLLRRSLEEILDNAVKFSPEGGTITLEVRGAVRGDGHERRHRTRAVEVTVVDEGIGIAPSDVSKIFSDFQQLDGSETRTFGGLGLGLAFVRRIVEAHDGTVTVESEPEQGTRLTVSIPAASNRASP